MTRVLLFSLAALLIGSPLSRAGDCNETVLIDSVEYQVNEIWCGKRIDSADLADKDRLVRIPEEYCFEDYHIYVDIVARDAFVRMAEAAAADSIVLITDSGYRSARYQERIISEHMKEGQKFADITRYVAPPGYSDHETGRSIDIVPSDPSFARTDAYRWLVQTAGEFGFEENFPKDTTGLTPWEPWHWTYFPENQE
ncbi:MAG: M15 family metallopeptidase [Candidatus Zixiibacteriota bacterium]|nr:MAG: M15 family metallopeptidase [candidate division Zixibacteria bacterium]